MSVILFLAVLFVLVLVHEWGHFIVAKKTGMRVDEFGIGFPPKIWGWRRGETLYTLNLLPIGGFVKIYGENPDEVDSQKAGDDGARAFGARSKRAQAAVLLAGVTMNVVFAWLLFTLVFAYGVPTAVEETAAGPEARLVISQVLPGAPAALAGIPTGATVIKVETTSETLADLTPSAFTNFIEKHAAEDISIEYGMGDNITEVVIRPETNVISSNPDKPAVGVALAMVETVRSSLPVAVWEALRATVSGLGAITVGLTTLLVQSVSGTADFSQVAGPVGIAGLVGDAAAIGWTSLALFTAFISLNLAVINLLPFPALDGGRLLFVAIEAVTRRPINPVWAGRLNLLGFALLMLLMVVVTYNDILRLI